MNMNINEKKALYAMPATLFTSFFLRNFYYLRFSCFVRLNDYILLNFSSSTISTFDTLLTANSIAIHTIAPTARTARA